MKRDWNWRAWLERRRSARRAADEAADTDADGFITEIRGDFLSRGKEAPAPRRGGRHRAPSPMRLSPRDLPCTQRVVYASAPPGGAPPWGIASLPPIISHTPPRDPARETGMFAAVPDEDPADAPAEEPVPGAAPAAEPDEEQPRHTAPPTVANEFVLDGSDGDLSNYLEGLPRYED